MLLGFKTELKLNNQQRTILAKHAGTARHSWNWGLALCQQIIAHNKQCSPSERIKFPSAIDLHKWLVRLVKPENNWYYEVSKCAPQYALRNLADAFKRWHQGLAKFPRFKKKHKHDSFTLDGSIRIDHFGFRLPRIGLVKTYERLPYGFKPFSVTINRQADRWFISFKIDREQMITPKHTDVLGVDLGVKTLATLSDGKVIPNPRPYGHASTRLAFLQYSNRNKTIGSSKWKKAQLQIARLHRKVANIRKNTLHKLTSYLAKNHSKVVIEDLNVSGMLANRKLAKAIQDLGFYEFRRQLEYKCKLYGCELMVADRFYPSSKTCSNCGCIKKNLSLGERIYICDDCGFEIDRDLNAARNLESLGRVAPVLRSRDAV